MKKSFLFVAFALALPALYDYAEAAVDGWSAGTLTNIRYQSNRILVQQNGATNPSNCDSTAYIVLMDTHAQFEIYNSVLLTAYTTGKNIELGIVGCTNGGTSGYPKINEIWFKP